MRFSPDTTVASAGLSLVTKIGLREPGVESTLGGSTMHWKPVELREGPPAIFLTAIGIPRISINSAGLVEDVEFMVDGDNLTVFADQTDTLEDDPLALDMLNTFNDIYEAHNHSLCFRAIRQGLLFRQNTAAKAAMAREAIMQKHIDDMYATGRITVRI